MRLLRFPLLVLVVASVWNHTTYSQTTGPEVSDTSRSDKSRLLGSVDAEEKRGVVLSYTQAYRSNGQPVVYHGTLYLAITAFSVQNCSMKIATVVSDRFSGQVGDKPAGDRSSYRYSVEVTLTPEIANSLTVAEERPGQLDSATHPSCTGHRLCNIHWLELRSKRTLIHLAIVTNDFADSDEFAKTFDGMVNQFWIPLSSKDAGKELISGLQSFAATCGQ